MPIVNYVREHMRFIEYAADEKITANERLLWYALMHIMNARATGNDWPGEFIPIGNDRVLMYCPMGFDAMARARNGLKQKKLIDFKPGDKNKSSPLYKMNYFFPEETRKTSPTPFFDDNTAGYPLKTDNIGDNIGGKIRDNIRDNIGGKVQDNTGDNMGDRSINERNIYKYNPKKNYIDEEDEEEDDQRRTHAGARGSAGAGGNGEPAIYPRSREEAMAAWAQCFGARMNPATADKIGLLQELSWGFGEGVIGYAIRLAAEGGAGNPLGYAIKTLNDWKEHHVHSQTDAEKYVMLFRAASGSGDAGMYVGDAMAEIDAFSQERAATYG
ncbi:MAG: DnaD domain protein [Clostridia bacterium]|nr:DnaD domain protein [Clostridia bacterium]